MGERGASFLSRVRGLPAALAGMTASLGTVPDRPVSMVHLETALSQLSGVTEMVDDGLTEARARAEAGEATDLPGALEEAGAAAKAALERFSTALDTEIREKAVGDGRLGAQLYAAKLRYTLATEMDPIEVLTRARHDYSVVRAEMVRLARQAWSSWIPDRPLPEAADGDEEAENEIVRPVLDAIAGEHRRPDELLDWCTDEV